MNTEHREAVEVLLADRLFIYSLMHKVFGQEPTEQLLNVLTGEMTAEALDVLGEEGNVLYKGARFLQEVAKDRKDPAFLSRLNSEFNSLFIGPLKLIAPPWETVYIDRKEMLFQETTLKVRSFFQEYGVIPQGYPRVADDSLALELAFMAELAARAMTAFEERNDEELKKNLKGSDIFLEEHLLAWVPELLKRVADSETDYLYPQMTLVLDAFLKKDHEVLLEILPMV